MKRTISLIITVISSIIGYAQSGSWTGELNVMGQKLPLVFNFSDSGCTIDSPKQGAKGIKAEWSPGSNGEVNISIPMLGASYEGKYDGKEIKGCFKQSGLSLELNLTQGEAQKPKRPQTPVAPFPYKTQEVTFKNGDVELHGTLTLPENYTKNTPVVVMVTGSGQQNRDEEIFDHKPFAVIADAFARRGIATLRYDDRFWGDKSKVFANYTTNDFKQDALAAVNLVRKQFSKVGVLGHSEGGTIALLLAEEGKTDFIISMAGMVVDGRRGIVKQNEVLYNKAGIATDMVQKYCDALDEGLGQMIEGKKPEEIPVPADLALALQDNLKMALRQASTPWFLCFLKTDASKSLSKIECPVLAINGKQDIQVDYEDNLGMLDRELKTKVRKTIAYEQLNHLFQHCTTGLVSEYGEIEETISPEVLKTMSDWVNEITVW